MNPATFDTTILERLARDVERLMDVHTSETVLGPDLSNLVARIPSDEQVTPGAVVRLALLNDVLRIAEDAVLADADLSDPLNNRVRDDA